MNLSIVIFTLLLLIMSNSTIDWIIIKNSLQDRIWYDQIICDIQNQWCMTPIVCWDDNCDELYVEWKPISDLVWPQWETWPQGPQWIQWETWPQGTQWIQWEIWPQWETWPQGATWPQGPMWPEGPQWEQWECPPSDWWTPWWE